MHDKITAFWLGWEEYNYFINCTAVKINDFPKTNEMAEPFLNTDEFTLDELKGEAVNANQHKNVVESLAGLDCRSKL